MNTHKLWCEKGHWSESQYQYVKELVESNQPVYCLETGFCTGRSAFSVLNSFDGIKTFITIDIKFDYNPEGRKYKGLFEKEYKYFKAIENNSQKVLNKKFFATEYPNGIDWFTVDGGHTKAICSSDIENALPYMNKGGIILIDDYKSRPPGGCTMIGVTQACDEIFEKYDDVLEKTEWNVNGKGICVFKII